MIAFHSFSVSAAIALLLSILLLMCSAIISGSEVAFFSLTPQMKNEVEESNRKNAKNLMHLIGNPQQLLATILVGNNFVNVAIIMLLTYFTGSVFDFSTFPLLGFIFETVIITFVLLLFGEIIPKVYASQYPEKMALLFTPFILVMQKVFSRVSKLLISSTAFLTRQIEKYKKAEISIDELSHALELTTDEQDDDKEMLEGIIKFGNIRVAEIMTSRVDMIAVDTKTNFKDLLKIIIQTGYSRIPVYSENRDNIKGILYSKDLLPHLDKPANFRWQSLIRQAYYVPETKKIDDLLSEFQKNKVHLALVVDEYGGISGLVTLEDILEEIVGDISDEYDDEEKLYTKVDNHTYIFEAKILLNDFFKVTGINEEEFSKVTEEVETLAGLVLELKGEMPAKNEMIEYGRYVFEILSVDNRRIRKIKLHMKDNFDRNKEEN
ncbi:MAG TPA: gliding motility-associated protein GldE [Paludibacteraceae bacterium]|nr:gliding motility-associated protein GldE [Paludibacteraceae bacterium]OPZ02191.1 MAG: Magnesium and cobalt efflux protein CorC [Bacteroidetes bacterium ADurb.BinA395]MBP8967401.1 gliding motility-associated protein GldE [Paludibacteraceae bacterium]HOF99112.1 gliding motility-associated protein GldE [Paludibacteraceae bacterium]HOJ66399.1 gliding motility-associated protein GldE [Paludibacteraceae bacterium]